MKKTVAFYECEVCGNLVGLIRDGGGELVCCNEPMKLLEANTTDAAQEKHVPVGKRVDGKIVVTVGSAAHPMTEQHYIQWIAVACEQGIEIISLKPGSEPTATFCDRPGSVDVYAFCNLHGLWKSEI